MLVRARNVKERFVGFNDWALSAKQTDCLFMLEVLLRTLSWRINLLLKTYHCAAVTSGHLSELQKKVQDEYPMAIALFTHCYTHVLNLVLS